MKKTKIYVDTSVIGGCCDPEFQEWSLGLLRDFQFGIYALLLSELTDAEIADAPDEVNEIYLKFRKHAYKIVGLTREAIGLADSYLASKILTQKYLNDARHIAIATVAGADLVVSWNFKHIVHFDKIQKFNSVNVDLGYRQISIYSPREVTRYGRKDS